MATELDYECYVRQTQKASPAYYFVLHTARFIFRNFFGFKVVGAENIPPKGSYIIGCNHTSYMDPPVIGCAFPYPVFFFARKTLYSTATMRWLLPRMNSIPVDRDRSDIAGMRTSLRVVKAGSPLVVFPEGTRTHDGGLQPGLPGVGLLISKAKAPVLPIRLRGTYECWSRNMKKMQRHPLQVSIGKLIPKIEVDPALSGQDAYQAIADRVMLEISRI
jgi:1-acyl-sn-glycerol-3-phosphate acyltransferase